MNPLRYSDRREAGRKLAEQLQGYAGRNDLIVLALPRGGVPVGYEVAQALQAPLDVFVVRKLGVPGFEELALGAIASGGVRVLNESVLARLAAPEAALERVTELEMRELKRRETEYREGRPALELRDRTVILVDDGLATGASMRAAAKALLQHGVAGRIVAVPVAAADVCAALRQEVDEVVCPMMPEEFYAIGAFYADFSQTTDEEVRELLGRKR
jgi:predicted phosphoribosyltransferase